MLFLRNCLSCFVETGSLGSLEQTKLARLAGHEPKGSSGLFVSSAWMTCTCHKT